MASASVEKKSLVSGNKMKIVVFLLAAIFLIPLISARVIISEIMYSPTDNLGGSTNEWIELYNLDNDSVNLNNWNFSELSNGTANFHLISNATILAKGYIILARNDTKFRNYFNVDCPVIKTSFGYGLNNDGDTISIKNSSNELIDSASYDGLLANKNNKSLQFIEGWCPGAPTPGKANLCQEENETSTNETTYNNETQNNETITNNETIQNNTANQEMKNATNNTDNKKEIQTANKTENESNKSITGNAINSNNEKKVIYQAKNESSMQVSIYLLAFLLIALVVYAIKQKLI